MGTTFIILLVITFGFVIGRFSGNQELMKHNDLFTNVLLYLLLFTFGISFGLQKELLGKMEQLGWEIIILTVGGILGSIVLASIFGKIFLKEIKNEK